MMTQNMNDKTMIIYNTLRNHNHKNSSTFVIIKDARSVSFYPYNRSQILQYVISILNKLTFYKELQTFVTNNVFFDKKVKTQQQQSKK